MKMKCKGECGKEKATYETSVGGITVHKGDKMTEWVCGECWNKGVRTEHEKGKSGV